MEGHGEAAADVITGGVIARAIEPNAGGAHAEGEHGKCRNCGTALSGPYCSACGQPAHLHRSLASLGHDILHGVFHFEGKIWRTIPELIFHPGRLTKRYIAGERAKFVSPMALYLFTVFLMFAVFSFTSGTTTSLPEGVDMGAMSKWKSNIEEQMARIDKEVPELQAKLQADGLSEAERAGIENEIKDQQATREAMAAMVSGDWRKMAELERQENSSETADAIKDVKKSTTWPPPNSRLWNVIQDANDNPKLMLYKLKSASYKYSWALIPLSVPFMWLLFFWRRDVHLYDHAIFVTYSISFMMLYVMTLSILATVGVSGAIWGTSIAIVPPLHLYKQLRGAYGLSRFGAFVRLFLLNILIIVILTLFSMLLVTMGLLG
ncbi:MAG: DUF3667 domain-containing protein [Steroidobacter sp.]